VWSKRIFLAAACGAAALIGVGPLLVSTPADAATATTYYVDSLGGSDGNSGTSSAAAWKTLRKVNSAAFDPGDTIRFKRGQAWTGSLHLSSLGTASSPITVSAYGSGALPRIGGKVTECITVDGSYWNITGLWASGCNWAGIEIRGDHNTLTSVRADHNVTGVSITEEASSNTLRGSTLTDNNKMSVNTPGGYDDSGAFGVLLNGDDNLITGNTITGSYASSYDYGHDGAAVEVFNGDRNRVEYNLTRDNETFTELGHAPGETADGNVYAYNLVTSVHDTAAFLVTRGAQNSLGPVRGTVAVNNSVSLPGEDTQGWVCYAGCAADILKLRNNAFSVGGKTGYEDGDGADEDNSVYWGQQTQFELGPGSIEADPLYRSSTDLRLLAGSPAVERGVPTGYTTDLAGQPVPATKPDAGAYQHNG
jgi:hypothetical protein